MKYAIYGTQSTVAAFEPRTARAHCEGRKAFFDGVSVNPFTEQREKENFRAWAEGHADATAGTIPGFCAV